MLIVAHLIREIMPDNVIGGRYPLLSPFSIFSINKMRPSDHHADHLAPRLSIMLVIIMALILGMALVTVPYLIIRLFLAAVGAVPYNIRQDWTKIRKEGLPCLAAWILLLVTVPVATDAICLFISDHGILPSVVLDNE
jgi:hypothetical protein